MPDSTQSFTLDEVERQRILGDLHRSQSQRESCFAVPSSPSEVVRLKSSLGEGNCPSSLPIFEYSYSQHLSPTQEDTSSFRQQLDQAPPETRDHQEVENIFDDESVPGAFQPIETSTAVPRLTSQEESFAAPSVIENDDGNSPVVSEDPSSAKVPKIFRTPAINRLKNHETPAGLTQMFQSSQDTPVLQSRKSTYVSMKDSQQGRHPDTEDEDDDSAEEDPDFPRIRRRKSSNVRASAAHSIMDRLRERAVMAEDDGEKLDLQKNSGSVAPQESDFLDDSVIPASAPVQSPEEYVPDLSSGGTESVITDSQPQSSERQTHPSIALPGLVKGSSQINETIQFYLPSSYPEVETEGPISDVRTEMHTAEALDVSSFPSRIIDQEQSENPLSIGGVQSTVKPVESSTLSPTVATDSVTTTGHDNSARSLKGTPMPTLQNSYDPTQIDIPDVHSPLLHRSASHSLPSVATPVQTSVRISARSKSLHLPYQTPDALDFSSPVLQAGDRRRPRRPPIIAESPVDSRKMDGPRKRSFNLSSLPEDGSDVSTHRLVQEDRPKKRLRVDGEVRDSQSMRRPNAQNTPAQPSFYLQRASVTPRNGSELSRNGSDEDSPGLLTSSPLTSLASEDFVREESSHATTTATDEKQCSRRVFALYDGTESYYPGELLDSSIQGISTPKDTLVKIKFDDTDQGETELLHVRPLDLRIGDTVKVNVAGIKSKQLSIISLQRDTNLNTGFTDIHGNTSFEARRKDNGTLAIYTIDQIYLPPNLFKPFLKRTFPATDEVTKLEEPVTPSRRQTSRVREVSPTLSFRGSQSSKTNGTFSNIAFSVTISQAKVATRDRIERRIAAHGGLLMCDGLDQLFEESPFSEERDIAPLRLTATAKTLRSAVVIADNPSRRAKYLQALSLGLPCLHYSYIEDCLASKRLLEIGPYLLAAGEGMLGGTPVMLSMTCTITNLSSSLMLSKAIEWRRQIYAGKQMIIVTGPVRESRKIHLFLSWAMGCEDLTECHTLEEAHHLMMRPEDGKHWDLISVHERDSFDGWVEDLKGRLVTNEDVVQSLITGRLCISS